MALGDAPRLRWGHININVRDLDRSVAFYGKLGFEVFLPGIPYLNFEQGPEPRPLPDGAAEALGLPNGARGRACIIGLGGGFPKIDLTELADLSPAKPLSSSDVGIVRICLGSSDLEADVARLAALGVEFLSGPRETQDGRAEIAVCVDPDGTLIELIEVHLERWPPLPAGG